MRNVLFYLARLRTKQSIQHHRKFPLPFLPAFATPTHPTPQTHTLLTKNTPSKYDQWFWRRIGAQG